MRLLSRISMLLIAVLLGFSSCDNEQPIGIWSPMKWNNVDNLTKTNNIYVIPAEGGSFTFECKNYAPWLSDVIINTERQKMVLQENWNRKEYKNEWFEVKIIDKKVIFTFDKIEKPMTERTVEVEVTAGDIYDDFVFKQAAIS